jgi:tetratricopeptide (TPR) repeat protein
MNRPICVFALTLATAATALGYGREGHEAVGELARQMLQSSARQAVVRILGGDDLAAVSAWADELKLAEKHQGPLAGNPEADAVNAKFPLNHLWHFADLPLGTQIYGKESIGSGEDVVHAIIGVAISELAPKKPHGWCRRATALHRLGRTAEAREVLLQAVDAAGEHYAIFYEIARYSCLIGRVPEARIWLAKALDAAKDAAAAGRLKMVALEEPDLAAVWTEGNERKVDG